MARVDADSAGVYFLTRECFEARSEGPVPPRAPTRVCDECRSAYYSGESAMQTLCPECAHRLYGHAPCQHVFRGGRCERCYWDGSISESLIGAKALGVEDPDQESG